jgi:beta-glucanase (GH16 family)
MKSSALFPPLLALALACGGGSSSPSNTPAPPPSGTWTLSWSDEFNGADGSAPDATKWAFDLGGGGWGNQELETYTNRTQNVQVQGGNLVITAARETFTGSDGITRDYTSGRIKTLGLFAQRNGRFEARIKIPRGQGMWPAFWLLGQDLATNGWPTCGEIDILENVGNQPTKAFGSLHGPGYSGGNALTGSYTLPTGALADDYHVYAVEWEGTQIKFYVDDNLYETRTSADMPTGGIWVFDHPFFLVLNLAVGGNWPGSPDGTTSFPQKMLVDYVRVYTKS